MKITQWAILVMVAGLPLIQGCVPLVATGAVGTGLVAQDRRTSGTQLDDKDIELQVADAISKKYGSDVNVEPSSFNRNLLLTGQVPDEATRTVVEDMARKVANVRQVVDEIKIGPPSSLTRRAEEAYLTTKVNARFLTDNGNKFSPLQVSVISDNGVVYLMGLVTKSEGDAAAAVASTTTGVKRVVKVFEYTDAAPANEPVQSVQPESKTVPVQPPAPVEEALPGASLPVTP
ncbi:MAG: BON domain-containing protein [Ferrovum sp.]|nr:BON domain-containing protein [Ferrovum sp.]NDU86764.1 BON domain-containing protein [Ferrovum sp.]